MQSTEKRSVLFVDDEPEILESLEECLEPSIDGSSTAPMPPVSVVSAGFPRRIAVFEV